MRAVVLEEYGDASVLRVREIPDQDGKPTQVLVRMAASGLNRLDVFVRSGLTGPGVRSPRSLPHVMGAEGSGVVVEVGPDADTELRPGDPVIVFSGLSCGHCRYCRRGETSRCPEYAILGEDVWGVQRERVVEAVGAPTWRDSIRSLAMGGRMMLCGATGGDQPDISIREIYQAHRQIIGAPFGGWNDFVDVVQMLDRTGLRPVVHATYPMTEIADAHRLIEQSQHVGKVVVTIG